jgi:hypothetical protein
MVRIWWVHDCCVDDADGGVRVASRERMVGFVVRRRWELNARKEVRVLERRDRRHWRREVSWRKRARGDVEGMVGSVVV